MKFTNKISKGDVIAVGDIHGTWDLYSQFLAWIKGSGASVILLGDIIDRGLDDMLVLETTSSLLENPESWGLESFNMLRGNHEQMFMDAVKGKHSDMMLWLGNGGNLDEFDKMEKDHYGWISNLPIFMVVGDTLFVHAGVQPGKSPVRSLSENNINDLIWIRQPFLKNGPMFEMWNRSIRKVVHGHSVTFMSEKGDENNPMPIVKKDRINIDTGAFLSNGRLTIYNATQNTFHQFSRPQ